MLNANVEHVLLDNHYKMVRLLLNRKIAYLHDADDNTS